MVFAAVKIGQALGFYWQARKPNPRAVHFVPDIQPNPQSGKRLDEKAKQAATELAGKIPGVRALNGGKLENARIIPTVMQTSAQKRKLARVLMSLNLDTTELQNRFFHPTSRTKLTN